MATAEKLMTAEEFRKLPDDGRRLELERGELLVMNRPGLRHGYVCTKTVSILDQAATDRSVGRVFSNDTGVLTEREPDTVRGPDVMFYSFARLPPDQLPEGYADVPPEIACEVMSPDDRPARVIRKIAEYLTVGVQCVLILDPEMRTISVHRSGAAVEVLDFEQDLTLPELASDFHAPVARFFL